MANRWSLGVAVALIGAVLAVAAVRAQEDLDSRWPEDEWATSTPEEQGMESGLLAAGVEYLLGQDRFDIHSLTIVRHGAIVADVYFHPFAKGGRHALASVTKSFISTLVGVAIEGGYIRGVELPVLDLLQGRHVASLVADKEAITVEDLLTMTSGLDCAGRPGADATRQMTMSPDWVGFTLDLPMADPPGTRWVYCNPASHLLSAIIAETTGMSTEAFAREHLFGPLGITDVAWPTDPQGYNLGYAELIMRPTDVAKLGYLYLRGGRWDDEQLLSSEWVEAATTAGVGPGYGYLWWLNPPWFSALGTGGQRIDVFPKQDLVIATTGGGGSDPRSAMTHLLTRYVLPAVQSDTPLPADPAGTGALEASIRLAAAAVPADPLPVRPAPATARRVSGLSYVLDANPQRMQSVSFTFDADTEATLHITDEGGDTAEWRIGLDNVPRSGSGRHGMPTAAVGGWESEETFTIHVDQIGGIGKAKVRVTFDVDRLLIEVADHWAREPAYTVIGSLGG